MVNITFELLIGNFFEKIYIILIDLRLLWKLTNYLSYFYLIHLRVVS